MKRSKVLIALALFGASASFWNCGSDPAPPVDPQDAQLAKLSKTWKATAVTFDSAPVTGYETFTLTISGTAGQDTFDYTTSGRPSGVPTPWPASGQWTFGTDFSTVVIRTDYNLPVTYSLNSTATILQLSFNYDCPASSPCPPYTGRTSSVAGQWSFTFGL